MPGEIYLDLRDPPAAEARARALRGTRPRGAMQLALFVGRNQKYVRAAEERGPAGMSRIARPFSPARPRRSTTTAFAEPIIACHRLKVLVALEDELRAAPDAPWAETACAAVNRYLHTPMKRHHGLRIAAQALDFVAREG